MGRVLVIISNSDLKKKILSLCSKIQGTDFFFLSDINDFNDEFILIQPDVLIVGENELKSLGNKVECCFHIKSLQKFILADHELTELSTYQDLRPIILTPDFNITDLQQFIEPATDFNIQFLSQFKPIKWIFDNLPIGLFWKDLNLKYLGCNKIFADDKGFAHPDSVIGLSDYDLFEKRFADEYVLKDRELIDSNKSVLCYEESVIGEGGFNEIIRKRKVLIYDNQRNVIGIMGMYEKVTEERQREIELRDEKRYLQMLMDNIPDMIYFKDLQSRFMRINKAHEKALGVQNSKDAVGKTDLDFFDKSHAIEAFQDEQEMMKTGLPLLSKLEYIKTFDGYRYVTSTKIPVRDEQGGIIGMVGVSRDVTESHNIEMKLQQETNLLNTLLDNVPDSIYFKDKSSRFIRISNSWLRKNYLKDDLEVIGKTDADFYSSEFANETFKDEQTLMETGKPLINKLESRIDALGNQLYKLANKVAVFDENKNVVGMIGISHDITELKLTEFKLAYEMELLQSLMDNVPDTIYFKDTDSRFTRINQAFAMALGLNSVDEAIGKTDFDFFHEDQARVSYEGELEILKSGEPKINRIEKVQNADGRIIWISTTKIPIKNQFGKITGIVGISRDVTDLEEVRNNLILAKEQAEEASRAKSLFLANMSHEIRTPMNGIIGMTDIMNQTVLTDDQQNYLTTIAQSGTNLLFIINNILDFSKIESGSLELEKAQVSIRQVLENVADILIITASNKGVNLVNYVDSSIPEIVEGDSVRLQQILLNLVNNALKFTERGEVFFTAELVETNESGSIVLFKVKDTGIGIPKDAQQKIFKSFTQVDSSTTRKFGGTGLGLAISKRLVEKMGGSIGVESVENEGSLFWFTAKFGIGIENKPVKPASVLLIDGLKVLIVDDNRTNRFVFMKYLETWNCKYAQAENGEMALKMLIENADQNNAFDVALIDFQMERIDGLELASRIKENPKISSTRLILLSSVTDVIRRSEVSKRGFNYFLNKPVKLMELYKVILSVTGNNEGEKQKPAVVSNDCPTNLSVLVAEDNYTNLKVAHLILKPFIAVFDSAENGQIAFEKFKTNKYDVIFMDVQMPVMNGYEATKSIRDFEKENNLVPVKIVAMTANAMTDDVELCMNSGMNEYLSKPFKRDDVIRIIGKLNLEREA